MKELVKGKLKVEVERSRMMPLKPRVRAEKFLTLLGPKYGQLQHGTVAIREDLRRTSYDRPRDAQKKGRAEHDPEQEALENAQSTKRRRTITHRAAMPQSDFLPCLVL